MKRILFILLFTTPFIGFGQSWEKTFDFYYFSDGMDVKQTSDGGYILICNWWDGGQLEDDVVLIKTNNQGDTTWTKVLSSVGDQRCFSIELTNDGGYIIGGYQEDSTLSGDLWVIKTDSIGNIEWDKNFGGNKWDGGSFVKQLNDNNYLITGYDNVYSLPNGDDIWELLVVKLDTLGNTLWYQTYYDSTYRRMEGRGVVEKTDNEYIILGRNILNYGYHSSIIKIDSLGNQTDYQIYSGSSSFHDMNSIEKTNDNHYVVTGDTEVINSGNYFTQTILSKIDSLGNVVWTQNYGGIENSGRDVEQTNDGGYIITGFKKTVNNSYDLWLIKTDSLGVIEWDTTFGGVGEDIGTSIEQTNDGGYIICGSTQYFNGRYHIYLIKTDDNGNVTSTFNIPTPSTNRKLENVIDILGRETKPQHNTPFIEIYDDGSTEKKIVVD